MTNDSKPFRGLLNIDLTAKQKAKKVISLEAERISQTIDALFKKLSPLSMEPQEMAELVMLAGGPRKVAKALGVGKDWVYRRLSGKTPIKKRDERMLKFLSGYEEEDHV